MSQIVTGEAVALELRIAQIPSRIAAATIDFAIMLIAFMVLLQLAGAAMPDPAADAAVTIGLVTLVFLGYPLVLETTLRGRTVGKLAMGLRVVRDDAGPIAFRHALVRAVTGLTLERPGVMLFGLGSAIALVAMLFSGSGKRIGDMAAGTVVIQERVAPQIPFYPMMPWPLAQWAALVELTAVDDDLALALRQFLNRAGQLEARARDRLERNLYTELTSKITPRPPADAPAWAVFAAVLAERRRRDGLRMAGMR